jgi:FG-GAP repeat
METIAMLKTTSRRLTLTAIALSSFVVLPAAGQVINEDLKLIASDGTSSDRFGISVAIDNSIVAIGAYFGNGNSDNSGSAYLFDASTGAQIAKLLASDGEAFDEFGRSIGNDNGVVAVGAPSDDDNGDYSGSAYLFDASTGVQIAKLLPSDGEAFDEFGCSIAIDDGVIAVGAWGDFNNGRDSGSAYLFDISTGKQLFKLLPNDGAAGDSFGFSIDIDNGVVAVGAIGDNDNGVSSGSVYLFDASTGTQLFKLLPNDGAAGDSFGFSIDSDNGVVAVGARSSDDNGISSGSAYLFDASTGLQIAKLLPSDGAARDLFGCSIAIDDGIVAVGADWDDDNGIFSGSAYLFDAFTGSQIAKLLPSDGATNDFFGRSIDIDNGVVVGGASDADNNSVDSGSAYIFAAPTTTPCPADLTNDGTLNFFDVSGFLVLFQLNDPIADFNNDSRWNFFDVSAFLQAFAAGCP